MKVKKQLCAWLLSLCMLMLPTANAFAAQSETQDSDDTQIEGIEDSDVASGVLSIDVLRQAGMPNTTAWYKNYRIYFQNAQKYADIRYGRGTVYSSACGPAALCNALYAAGIADVDLLTMCNLAVSCGARVSTGTVEDTLLKAAAPLYGFTYKATNSISSLKQHLQSGGVAIIHAGDSYPLFTTSGHYMTAVEVNGSNITLLDSYWWDEKYTYNSIRKKYAKVLSEGVVQTSLTQLEKAVSDRSPHYYLLYKTNKTDKTDTTDKTAAAVSTAASAAQHGDAPFTDVYDNTWYYANVISAYQQNLMVGVSRTSFAPEALLTRAQAVQILYNYAKQNGMLSQQTASTQFVDVPDGAWYQTAVEWASANGITNGTDTMYFSPEEFVTREQFVTLLYRYSEHSAQTGALSKFTDASTASEWAVDALNWAASVGILSGESERGVVYLHPRNNATRAQAAKIIEVYNQMS